MRLSESMNNFFQRKEKVIPFLLFILFLVVSLPGISWGTPDIWNPDELVGRVDLALGGELQFDETEPDYNYPSLPKYVMFGIGKVVFGLGYSRTEFIIASRVFSALLAGVAVVLVYSLARKLGGSILAATLAGFLMIASGVIPYNARFGHNDMYLLLFVILCIYSIINYHSSKNRLWLYTSFYCVGLAASSKYTGGSLILLPLFVLLVLNWSSARTEPLASAEKLFIGTSLAFIGYATGTPKALFWASHYFKRVLPALGRYPVYGLQPDSLIGLFGQWQSFKDAVGGFEYYLFLITLIVWILLLVLSWSGRNQLSEPKRTYALILIATLVIFDLPFMISVNYIPRYFIPFVPLLSLLTAMLVDHLEKKSFDIQKRYVMPVIYLTLAAGLTYSLLRVVSTNLLFVNDSRAPASEYLHTLRPDTTIEYTLYPPILPQGHFARTRNYPIFLLKYPGDTVPQDKPYEYNTGEEGLMARGVDYLVVDSFTYGRFSNEYICNSNPVECEFFTKLLTGETSLHLLKKFEYHLPLYMPYVTVAAVNPDIRVYELIH